VSGTCVVPLVEYHTYTCIYMHASVCVCVCIHVSVCVCVCIHVSVHNLHRSGLMCDGSYNGAKKSLNFFKTFFLKIKKISTMTVPMRREARRMTSGLTWKASVSGPNNDAMLSILRTRTSRMRRSGLRNFNPDV
jgi:hypothetical protein